MKLLNMNFKEWHHGYMGAIMIVIGLVVVALGHKVVGAIIYVPGLIILFDDLYQHSRQALGGEENYQSPLKRFYAKYLWPIPFVQKLSNWLDSVL